MSKSEALFKQFNMKSKVNGKRPVYFTKIEAKIRGLEMPGQDMADMGPCSELSLTNGKMLTLKGMRLAGTPNRKTMVIFPNSKADLASFGAYIKKIGCEITDNGKPVALYIGTANRIVYESDKEGDKAFYKHTFHRPYPNVVAPLDGKGLYIYGGKFKIKDWLYD